MDTFAKPVPTTRQRTHERWLTQLTSLPTAAGHEGRVMAWIEKWAHQHHAQLKADRHGNRILSLDKAHGGKRTRQPIVFAAHTDHPAFVVTDTIDAQHLRAEFRGGVDDRFFLGMRVLLYPAQGQPIPGRITKLFPIGQGPGRSELFKRVIIKLTQSRISATPQPGDLLTWALPPATIKGKRAPRLHAPACDDLAGLAAALAAWDELRRAGMLKQVDVRLLFTRAEEIGFIGAIGACSSGILPKQARILALENSKSFAESPIGAGPIVRTGDRTSTFDPQLTYLASQVAQQLAQHDPDFLWQRKLMPGGTCEASAYQSLGYAATCLCLPLGNYHNMNETSGKIESETISLADYHGLVRLLIASAVSLSDTRNAPDLNSRLRALFDERRFVLQ